MTDFAAYCPVVNRPDLLQRVIAACKDECVDLFVIDNSPLDGEHIEHSHVFQPCVPYTFSQSMNFEFTDAIVRRHTIFLHMHSDAVIPRGTIPKLLDLAREANKSGRKWAVIYTYYDVLAAYNPLAYEAIGGFDTNIRAYMSDNDWYRRCDLAGWERIQMPDHGVEHGVNGVGSQTINSDPELKRINGIIQKLDSEYYRLKWGGPVGRELYSKPFNNL